MNTDRLIKYLKNDLSELTEIFNELKPGSSLSSLEIKMILNRINSVNEEFELLEVELNNSSKFEEVPQLKEDKKVESKPIKKEPIPEENTVDIIENSHIDTTEEEIQSENLTEEPTKPVVKIEPEIEEPSETYQKEQVNEYIVEEPEILQEEEEEEEEEESVAVEETDDEPIYKHIEEEIIEEPSLEQQQTIADKYEGSTSSLNDHIAKHIEQKDLASKLQQNPIDDLTKAIKLNDKIWYSNELFEGNLDLYRETIRTINKMNELEEALSFLESNFQFDQTKKSFKSFIEMIYRRFLK